MKIKKGDTVLVVSGKWKGKTGKVLRAFPKEQKILVEGVNIVKKHLKPSGKRERKG
jgi:large subunit ribosomal protein L24